jgi:hypothetical protein
MRNGMITNKYGDRLWYQDNRLHRTNGPAVEYENGTKFWYQNNERHRTDGPAVELPGGRNHWYINGIKYDLNDWLELVNYTEPQKTLMRLQYA